MGVLAAAKLVYALKEQQIIVYNARTMDAREVACDRLQAFIQVQRNKLCAAVATAAKVVVAATAAGRGWMGGRAGSKPAIHIPEMPWYCYKVRTGVDVAPYTFAVAPPIKTLTMQRRRHALGVATATLMAFDAARPGVVRSQVPAGAKLLPRELSPARKQRLLTNMAKAAAAHAAAVEARAVKPFQPEQYWMKLRTRLVKLFSSMGYTIKKITDVLNKDRAVDFQKLCTVRPRSSSGAGHLNARTPPGRPFSLTKQSGRSASQRQVVKAALKKKASNNQTGQTGYGCNQPSAALKESLAEEAQGLPTLLFHGTAQNNITPIIQAGLRVPYKGNNPIGVANGSANGVGIYTAKEPNTSLSYTRGSNQMFVCAGLTKHASFNSTSVAVFKDERHVLPCFLVDFGR
jgi:hypothetical protein